MTSEYDTPRTELAQNSSSQTELPNVAPAMDRLHLLEVPFNSAGTTDGVANMPKALVDAGLDAALARRLELTRSSVRFDRLEAIRGLSGLLAEQALGSMVDNLSAAVRNSIDEGAWPLVVGGDCAVLLGILRGLTSQETGLLFVDGHEDAWPPSLSTTGETADCELGLALGLYPAPVTLGTSGRLVEPDRVAVVGPRDRSELDELGVPSVRDRVCFVSAEDLLKDDLRTLASEVISRIGSPWWLHVDLDVLSTEALSAIDYPQPGGLTWADLDNLTAAALSARGCIGASVVIYNPDLDRGLAAPRIVQYIEELAARAVPV